MNTFILIENGKVVGTTTFKSLEGYEVLPAPEGWDGNLERLKYENGQLTLIPEEEYIELKRQKLLKELTDKFNRITDDYFYTEAENRGDYKNMGEIYVDAQGGDEDAKYLLQLYNAVWDAEEKAENEIDQLSDLNQLLSILKDVPGYLLPKLEEAKQNLDASPSSQTSTASTSTSNGGQ